MFGERAEGHAAHDQGIDLPDRRHPSVLIGCLENLLRRQDAPQEGPELELVSACVQGRVGEHGDADELDAVEHAGRVVPSASPSPRLSALVCMEPQFIGLFAPYRKYGGIGTDERAHAAPYACMRGLGLLIDLVKHAVDIPGPLA